VLSSARLWTCSCRHWTRRRLIMFAASNRTISRRHFSSTWPGKKPLFSQSEVEVV